MALKYVDIPDENARLEFYKEVDVLRSLRHPNIVQFLGACYTEPSVCIATEYMINGSLDHLLDRMNKSNKRFSIKKTIDLGMQISRGMNWLHKKGIIHRDFKPANILVSEHNTLKIADFGLAHVKPRNSHELDNDAYGVIGTTWYMAPEVLRNQYYSAKADVYSFGVVFLELITGKRPFDGTSAEMYSERTLDEAVIRGRRPQIPEDCWPPFRNLIQSCFQEDPDLRPTMQEVLQVLQTMDQQLEERDEVRALPSLPSPPLPLPLFWLVCSMLLSSSSCFLLRFLFGTFPRTSWRICLRKPSLCSKIKIVESQNWIWSCRKLGESVSS